jgi:hypothetical protein
MMGCDASAVEQVPSLSMTAAVVDLQYLFIYLFISQFIDFN